MSSNSDNECTRLLSPLQLPRPNRGSPRWQLFPQQRDKDCYGNYNESERENENENENDKATENENDDDVRSRRSSRSGGSRSSSQQRQRQRNAQQQQQQQNQQKCIHRDSMISMGPIVGVSKPIKKWYRGIVVRQSCHNRLASDFLARDAHLGTLSVVLTTVTSSAIFASLVPSTTGGMDADADADADATAYEYEYEYGWSELLAVLAGTIAAFNTVLQGITRTLYYGQWGERHLRAYREYSVLRFQLESIVGDKPLYAEHKVDRNKLEAWIRSYEEVLEESPTIPQKVFDRVASEQDRKGLSWTKDDREVRAIIDEERKLAAIRESKLMSSDPSLFP